ncbi:hypothetical protein Tco_1071416 [Tanacetum coccineum]
MLMNMQDIDEDLHSRQLAVANFEYIDEAERMEEEIQEPLVENKSGANIPPRSNYWEKKKEAVKRWAFIDLRRGPFSLGPAVGGEDKCTKLSLKGIVHHDMWIIDPKTWVWNKVKKGGMPLRPRDGFSMSAPYTNDTGAPKRSLKIPSMEATTFW